MKPLYRKITQASGSSFSFVEECPPLFETPWHFHPEYELILIEESTGKRYMGDNIAEFDSLELVLIGPNLPHFWRNDETDLGNARAYVIHFKEDFLGKDYFQLIEMLPIKNLLELTQTGIKITGQTKYEIAGMIKKLAAKKGFQRLIVLQEILFYLATSNDFEPLSSIGFVESFKATNDDRIKKVFEFVIYHFHEKINLQTVASMACMSNEGFCRYFKKTTGKSFFIFLNEIRIGYACRLLIEGNLNITQICYEAGFNNLSHFNRQFRDITGHTPHHYREIFKTTEKFI